VRLLPGSAAWLGWAAGVPMVRRRGIWIVGNSSEAEAAAAAPGGGIPL